MIWYLPVAVKWHFLVVCGSTVLLTWPLLSLDNSTFPFDCSSLTLTLSNSFCCSSVGFNSVQIFLGISLCLFIFFNHIPNKPKISKIAESDDIKMHFFKTSTWHWSLLVEIGGNWRKLVKNWILELYLVKFTWKLKFFLVWSII